MFFFRFHLVASREVYQNYFIRFPSGHSVHHRQSVGESRVQLLHWYRHEGSSPLLQIGIAYYRFEMQTADGTRQSSNRLWSAIVVPSLSQEATVGDLFGSIQLSLWIWKATAQRCESLLFALWHRSYHRIGWMERSTQNVAQFGGTERCFYWVVSA